MPNKVTVTTQKSWGSRIMASFKGILIGFLLFIVSFGVLYWNEGRTDMSKFVQNAEVIDSANVSAEYDGQFVSTSGKVITEQMISDDLYLKPGNYLAVKRIVEMYAWVEESESETETKLGGSEETTTTYTYVKKWTNNPPDSSDFQEPGDHENPNKPVADSFKKTSSAKIGAYQIDMENANLPPMSNLNLTEDNTNLTFEVDLDGGYIYRGTGYLESPDIGDIRIKYMVLKPGFEGTIFGRLNGSEITTYQKKDDSILRLFKGSREDALLTMAEEHKTSTWILRLIGFLMMWFGLSMILGPISVLFDILPILGKVSRFTVNLATFIVALVLSIITIIVSLLLHNIIAILVIMALVVIAIVVFLRKKDIFNKLKEVKKDMTQTTPEA